MSNMKKESQLPDLLYDLSGLNRYIKKVLLENFIGNTTYGNETCDSITRSAVLLLLGMHRNNSGISAKPGIFLNKRSERVKQPGDLCCPGGRISPRMDGLMKKLLYLPGFPLYKSSYGHAAQNMNTESIGKLALYLTTSLRESYEEMRLNPLSIKFLGPLPTQQLSVFKNIIYPMAGWLKRKPEKFRINQEVERVVFIPLEELLEPANYARYDLEYVPDSRRNGELQIQHHPCFRYGDEKDLLWGATYRIVTKFLKIIFDFTPPDKDMLPTISGTLRPDYFTGTV